MAKLVGARLSVFSLAIAVAFVAVFCLLSIAARPAPDTSWPTYLHDNARSGITSQSLSYPLSQKWVFRNAGKPVPAWADPQDAPIEGNYELPRLRFDDAYHVSAAGGLVFFGSSATNKVYALDAATGEERWSFFIDGPVRLAPTVAGERVYFGSDDGNVYCLRAADGALVWKFRAAPSDERVLGRGKMISLWPVRTNVLVDNGVAYFCAGIFPAERIFIYAVGADDGSLIWKNDTLTDQDAGRFDISPQGYLLASPSILYVPSSRTLPAALDKRTGKLLYKRKYGWRSAGIVGGTYALLADNKLFSGSEQQVREFDQETGQIGFAWSPGRRLIVTPDTTYLLMRDKLAALDRKAYPPAVAQLRKVKQSISDLQTKKPAGYEEKLKQLQAQLNKAQQAVNAAIRWQRPLDNFHALILAGSEILAGGPGKIVALDARTGNERWAAAVEGVVKGLAVADGALFASTDTGAVYCFAPGAPRAARPAVERRPGAEAAALARAYRSVASRIIAETGVNKGYCLVLGCGTGGLAYALSQAAPELQIYAVESDAQKVAQARRALDAAGVYGIRVTVDRAAPGHLPYSDYFANLVVSQEALDEGKLTFSAAEAYRVLKPVGGVLYVGQPGPAPSRGPQLSRDVLARWARALPLSKNDTMEITTAGGPWLKVVRGPLEGAGSWTHQYGEPGNTASSEDTIVKCPLGVLWFGDPGPDCAVNRHAGTVAPLTINGRVFFQGIRMRGSVSRHIVMCFDAYNGVKYWEREIPGAYRVRMVRECSNLAANEDSLFVAIGPNCLQLDAATGETKRTFAVPEGAGLRGKWGYVAVVGETLYGSAMRYSEYSEAIFAYDLASGKLKWTHSGKKIKNNTITISDGRMFFADMRATSEQRQQALKEKIDELVKRKGISREQAEKELSSADVRIVVALDAQTGKKIWEKPVDLTDCGGSVLCAMCKNGVLVFCGAHSNGHFWPQFLAGEYASRRVTALSAEDGTLLWTKAIGYRIRPLIVGDTLYAEPWAFDLRTGKQKTRINPISGRVANWEFERPGHHCGNIVGCPNALFFRSYSLGYYDLVRDYGTNHFAGQRPGCWINFLPANGLLVMPEASSGCVCLFSLHCTTVLKPKETNKAWGIYDCPGRLTPVKRLGINLGAPGDRKDAQGKLWLSYPRPWGRMRVDIKLQVKRIAGGDFFVKPAEFFQVQGTDTPWLYASGCTGVQQCVVPLLDKGDGKALYTVRLGFVDTENDRPGVRVFDIKLQGKTVRKGFDIVRAAGGRNKAVVLEFPHIEVERELVIEFVPALSKPTLAQAPLLNTIEVVREKMLALGLSVPSFTLSDADKEKTGEVIVANRRETAFSGTLRIAAPQGFSATPAERQLNLPPDSEVRVPLRVRVAQPGKPAQLSIVVSVLRDDGSLEIQRRATLNYLGPRGRMVIKVSEDAYVSHGSPNKNYGTAASLLVDGGASAMGDESHNIAYLKFPLNIPGKPISVVLRIHVANSPYAESRDSGRICLVEEPWEEYKLTYNNRPKPGKELAKLGRISRNSWLERPLNINLAGRRELSLVLEPTTTDGANYDSREGGAPAELVVEYIPSAAGGR